MERLCQWISDSVYEGLVKVSHQVSKVALKYRNASRESRKKLHISLLWMLALLLIVKPAGGALAVSVNNQEFFSFHIRDIVTGLTGGVYAEQGGDYYLATGTYEEQTGGELFGIAEGRNLIVIQIESLQNIMINRSYNGQEITPNLNRLIRENGTLYFDHYYQQLGSGNTSDSEFVTNNSYMGAIESYTYQLYEENYFYGLPWILRDLGYETAAFHGFDQTFWNRENIYPQLGFETFIGSESLENDNIKGLGGGSISGISDEAFFTQSLAYMKEFEKPFYSFLVTLSSHHPFNVPKNMRGIEIEEADEDTLLADYINSVHYADQSLGIFLELLEENDMYEDSIIAVYGDHFGLPQTDDAVQKGVSKLLGYEYKLNHMLNIPLIIHVPGEEIKQTVSIAAGQVDFLPTICYLLGVEELKTLYLGQNLLTAETGFTFHQTHLLKGSFIDDNVVFEMSRDGVFANSKAWNVKTGEPVDIEDLEERSIKAKKLVELSDYYLKNDVLEKALVSGLTIEEIVTGTKIEREHPSEAHRISKDQVSRMVLPWDDEEQAESPLRNKQEDLDASEAKKQDTALPETEKPDTEQSESSEEADERITKKRENSSRKDGTDSAEEEADIRMEKDSDRTEQKSVADDEKTRDVGDEPEDEKENNPGDNRSSYLRYSEYKALLKAEDTDEDSNSAVKTGAEKGNRWILADVSFKQDSPSKIYVGDLIKYLEKFPEVSAFVRVDENTEERVIMTLRFLKTLDLDEGNKREEQNRKNLLERIVPVVSGMDHYTRAEYEGYRDIVLMPDAGEYTPEEMEKFIGDNRPWALVINIDKEDDDTFVSLRKNGKTFLYGYSGDGEPLGRSSVKTIGISGFIY